MKKILSLFSLLCVTVSDTIMSKGGIACKNSSSKPVPFKPTLPITKLNLNNLKIYGIKVTKGSSDLEIDGSKAYLNVEEQIIAQYDAITKTTTLTLGDFASDSTIISDKKSWAVEIYNINNSRRVLKWKNEALHYGHKTVLKDNALQIKVTTNDKNVTVSNSNSNTGTTKQAIVEGFLNKFIYTNANANQGHDIGTDHLKTAAENKLLKTNVIDFSSGTYNLNLPASLFGYRATFDNLRREIIGLSQTKRNKISTAIVTNLNTQLGKETEKLNSSKKLKIATNEVTGKGGIEISNRNIAFFTVDDTTNSVSEITRGNLVQGSKIFIRINVNNWHYLDNYLGTPNTYVYGYLGTVAVVRKYNIQLLEFHGITLNVTKYVGGQLKINAQNDYQAIRAAIITQYNDFFSQHGSQRRISENNFNLASETVTFTKNWAIAIKNGYGILSDTTSVNLGISATRNLANQNNTLNVKVTTNDPLVSGGSSITKEINLNKFVFNNQDANKNRDLQIPTTSAVMRRRFKPSNVIDLSENPYHLNGLKQVLEHGATETAANVLTKLELLGNDVILTNAVIDNLNMARDRISPTGISALPRLSSSSAHLLRGSSVLKIYIRTYRNHYDHNFIHISGQDTITRRYEQQDVYLQINISNWSYLTVRNHNFICPDETYVYAYLGEGMYD